MDLESMKFVMDRYQHLNTPSIRNTVISFKRIGRGGIIDSITGLRGHSSWPYVQENKFPGQRKLLEKLYVFKMSEVGPRSGVDIVKRMQPHGDLRDA
jgi:hypothetical protein